MIHEQVGIAEEKEGEMISTRKINEEKQNDTLFH